MVQTANNLPDSSRVWVYQSNRAFTDSEVLELKEQLSQFQDGWEAHGKKLNSAIEIYYNQFLVIFVDESIQEATGCSIDKSVALMKSAALTAFELSFCSFLIINNPFFVKTSINI